MWLKADSFVELVKQW
jgi:hypothetical protein